MRNLFLGLTVLAALLAVGQTSIAFAAKKDGAKPLLIEGKKTLYQRVLAKPGAKLSSVPGKRASKQVVPFTAFYVYSRVDLKGKTWVQVGYDSHGKTGGWVPGDKLIEWNHGLTISFRDPTGHDRVMLFRKPETLKALAATTDFTDYDNLYNSAVAESLPKDSPVVAIQPKAHIDIREDFYLIPIREYRDIFVGSEQGRLLRVSTVPHNAPVTLDTARANPQGGTSDPDAKLNTGVVFVMDSTKSMDPYIARTRAAVRKIYDDISRNDPQGNVSFGLVGFRDDPSVADDIEYRSLIFADLDKGASAQDFFTLVSEVKAAETSTKDFIEDPYAGVKRAIDGISWGDYQARYIILITDAGAREGSDPHSGTGMSAETLRRLARDNNIAIFVMHLLTKEGAHNHASAAKQYKALSFYPGIGDLYYGVNTGSLRDFGRALDTLGDQLVAQMRRDAGDEAPVAGGGDDQLDALTQKVNKLGYALRMQYLDRPRKGNVPQVFDAWMMDRDPKNPARKVLDVRVLLTRDQLSDLYQMLREVLETAEEGMLSPRSFLNDIKSLAAAASRDPEKMAGSTRSGGAKNLADLGFMREYIEGLPYTGEVMSVALDDWRNWSAKQQLDFIQRLEEKVSYYRALHDHTDLWVSLDGGPVDGDSVFPVPLEMLP